MGRAGTEKRSAAFRLGVSAERRAALLLAAKGYRTLAKRWKTPVGEVDLVVQRGSLIAFIEVKARAGFDAAAEAVLPRQKKRIIAAAEAWLAAHPEHAGYDMRFDAILVAPGKLPRHIEAAFEIET
ncbi:MAG TPA: YraN family protein [Xanthobacteraceae bacterium]|jgi:putative endonuclease|nr:YraN family protein [Xanthobacteraceae bacterium]